MTQAAAFSDGKLEMLISSVDLIRTMKAYCNFAKISVTTLKSVLKLKGRYWCLDNNNLFIQLSFSGVLIEPLKFPVL